MRILIADDQIEVRSALHLILERTQPQWRIDEVEKLSEIVYRLQILPPDILLVDWELPGLNSADPYTANIPAVIFAMFRRLCPGLHIIGLSAYPDKHAGVISAGANSFVSKSDPPECLFQAILDCASFG